MEALVDARNEAMNRLSSMGEHHEVAQFMIEQGGLSITGIQDIAACKVQVSMFSTTCRA